MKRHKPVSSQSRELRGTGHMATSADPESELLPLFFPAIVYVLDKKTICHLCGHRKVQQRKESLCKAVAHERGPNFVFLAF